MNYYIFHTYLNHDGDDPILDDHNGEQAVIDRINELIEDGYNSEEFVVIRGEAFKYVPPADKGSLVRSS